MNQVLHNCLIDAIEKVSVRKIESVNKSYRLNFECGQLKSSFKDYSEYSQYSQYAQYYDSDNTWEEYDKYYYE